MAFLWFLPAFGLRPVAFPEAPIQAEVRRGIEVYRKGKGLDRVLQEDRKVVGWRKSELRRFETEQVVWVSPSLVSRWLGYLWAKEKWPEQELQTRWSTLRGQLDGRLTFIVELAKLPDPPGTPGALERLGEDPFADVRIVFTAGGSNLPMDPQPTPFLGLRFIREKGAIQPGERGILRQDLEPFKLAEVVSRQPIRTSWAAWHNRVPFGPALSPQFDPGIQEPLAPLGGYVKDWFLVQAPVPKDVYLYLNLQLRILSKDPERLANFELVGGKAR